MNQKYHFNHFILRIAAVAMGTACLSQHVCAQGVGLVDMGAVFRAHSGFTQQLDAIRGQADSLKSASLQAQQDLSRKAEMIRQYDPSSSEFREAEASLAKEAAVLQVNHDGQVRSLMMAEARLHYNTYRQVNQLIASYCDQQGISLVLRFNQGASDSDHPEAIMQKVNNPIVYYQPGRDITHQIISMLASNPGPSNP